MATPDYHPPPKRKEPGLIGKLLSAITELITWLIISLILSILIEWIGMTYVWPDEKQHHAKAVFEADQAYLNQHLHQQSLVLKYQVVELTEQLNGKIRQINPTSPLMPVNQPGIQQHNEEFSAIRVWAKELYSRYDGYILAAGYVSQTFVIKVTLILFSLPVFALAALVGAVDGLVERDLRRWGGGRESSNVFNLAKRSITPSFMAACVIYIGLPFSLNPSVIILPFACLYGLAVRVTCERLKKYF